MPTTEVPKYTPTCSYPNGSVPTQSKNTVFPSYDGTSTSGTTQSTKKKTSEQSVSYYCGEINKKGVSYTEAQCRELLCCYRSGSIKALENDSKKLQEAYNHICKTIYILKTKGESLSFDSVRKAALEYSAAIESGWESIDSFEAANAINKEGLTARIMRETQYNGGESESMLGKLVNSGANKLGIRGKHSVDIMEIKNTEGPDAAVEQVKAYFKRTFKNPEKQSTDFTKLLINSSSDERKLMIDALEALKAENVNGAWSNYLKLAKGTEVTDAIEAMTPKKMQDIYTKTGMNEEQVTDFTKTTTSYQTTKEQRRQREYLNEQAKRYKDLKAKNPETLTKEDKEFIKWYEDNPEIQSGMRKGHIEGTLENKVNTEEENQAELTAMISDTKVFTEEIYDDVIESTREYINSKGGEFGQSEIDRMTGMMDEATQGEYTYGPDNPDNPYNDPSYTNNPIQNHEPDNCSYTSGTIPSQTVQSGETSPVSLIPNDNQWQNGLGFTQNELNAPKQRYTATGLYQPQQQNNGITYLGTNNTRANKLNEFINELKDVGIVSFIHKVMNKKGAIKNPFIKNIMVQIFESLPKAVRINIVNNLSNNSNADLLIGLLKPEELNKVKAQNSYTKFLINQKKKEFEKAMA